MSRKIHVIITSLLLALGLMLTGTAVGAAAPAAARLTVDAADGVVVSISSGSYEIGEPVDFSVATSGDYLIRGIAVTTEDGAVDFSVTGSFRYRFVMPSADVKIKISAEDYGIVSYGECALRLWRLAGSPEVVDADILLLHPEKSDAAEPGAKEDADSRVSAAWAVRNGILPLSPDNEESGHTDGSFDADKPLIREDLCRALRNFADLMGADTGKGAEEPETVDRELVSEEAWDGVCWAVGNDIVDTGNSAAGYFFRPAEKIVRCEFDTVISRFIAVTGIGAKNDGADNEKNENNEKNEENEENEAKPETKDGTVKRAPSMNGCTADRVSAD